MQHVADTGFPRGTVVAAANFQARWYEFSMALESLQVPAGTRLNLSRSCDIAHNFNQGVRKMTGEWCWFMGDDHAFDPHILLRLLAHRKPVVQPLVVAKIAPFRPCIMHGPYKLGMTVYRWNELPATGLWPLPTGDFVGQAGMLVQKSILDHMGDPWFLPGKLEPDRLQEDLYFCQRLQNQGETIWIDCDQVLDHIGHIVCTAVKTKDGWVPAIQSGDKLLALPGLVPETANRMPDIGGNGKDGSGRLKWEKAPNE